MNDIYDCCDSPMGSDASEEDESYSSSDEEFLVKDLSRYTRHDSVTAMETEAAVGTDNGTTDEAATAADDDVDEVGDNEDVVVADGKPTGTITHEQLHLRCREKLDQNVDLLLQNPNELLAGVQQLLKLIGRNRYRGGSVLRYQRFAKRLELLVRTIKSPRSGKDPAARTRRLLLDIRRCFLVTETATLLTRAKWNETFAKLVRETERGDMAALRRELRTLATNLERVRAVEGDEQTFQRYVFDIGKFDRLMQAGKVSSIKQATLRIRKINAYMGHRTTKAQMNDRYYVPMSTARVMDKSLIGAIMDTAESLLPYEDEGAMRYKRFTTRAGVYLRELYSQRKWARSANLLWTMRCYFEPMRGLPVLDRKTLLDKFGRLTAMVAELKGDACGKLNAINDYISALQTTLEGAESLADDIGISHEDFERFLEELAMLRDAVPRVRRLWPHLIVMRIDSMRDLVNPDLEPSDDDAAIAADDDGGGTVDTTTDPPLTADTESLDRFEQTMERYGIGDQPRHQTNPSAAEKIVLRRKMAEMLTMLEELKSTRGPSLRHERLARHIRSLREGHTWQIGWLQRRVREQFFQPTDNVMTVYELKDRLLDVTKQLRNYDSDDDFRMWESGHQLHQDVERVDRIDGMDPEKFEKFVRESAILVQSLRLKVAVPIIAGQLEYMRRLLPTL